MTNMPENLGEFEISEEGKTTQRLVALTGKAAGFSGGGSHCAVQIGSLLSELERDPDLDYDKMSGVSGGALNLVSLASTERGQLLEGAMQAERVWNQITGNESVFKQRILGALEGYFVGSLYNTKPLREIIEQNIDEKKIQRSGRQIRIGAVEARRRKYIEFTEQEEDLSTCFMASSAVPCYFPVVIHKGKQYIDGGIRQNVPRASFLAKNVKRIDLFLSNPVNSVSNEEGPYLKNLKDVLLATIDATYGEIWQDDLLEYLDYNNIEIRVFAPDVRMKGSPFEFNPKRIWEYLEIGRDIRPVPLHTVLRSSE